MTTNRRRCNHAAVSVDKHSYFYSTLRMGRSGDRWIIRFGYFDSVSSLTCFTALCVSTIHQANTQNLLAMLFGFINRPIDCILRLLRLLREHVGTRQTNQEG